MPERYKFTVTVDGCPCTGTWTLKQGGKVHVSCGAWGVEEVDCVPPERPETVVTKAAQRIVRAYHKQQAAERKRQERELARVHRHWDRKKKPESDHA